MNQTLERASERIVSWSWLDWIKGAAALFGVIVIVVNAMFYVFGGINDVQRMGEMQQELRATVKELKATVNKAIESGRRALRDHENGDGHHSMTMQLGLLSQSHEMTKGHVAEVDKRVDAFAGKLDGISEQINALRVEITRLNIRPGVRQ